MEGCSRIGIVGTGFIARGLIMALGRERDLAVSAVLTRSDTRKRTDFPGADLLTNSVEHLIDCSDIVVECTGDPIYATEVVDAVMRASLPVVTMDAELQITTGSYFASRGLFTEAEGDQPGCLAALREEAIRMGFTPLVYGNIKGYLNHTPAPDEMRFWAEKQGIALDKVVSFTDGTKVQIEQALVANGLEAGITRPGLSGIPADDVSSGAQFLAQEAKRLGHPISDYILSPKSPAGVFIAAEHDERFRDILRYYKMGEGPVYTLLRPFHLCNLEIGKTLRRVRNGEGILLNNGLRPTISVAAIAKVDLYPGDAIPHGMGSFQVRGSTVRIRECPEHIPIGLLHDAVMTRHLRPGEPVTCDDVQIPESMARDIWEKLLTGV